MLSQYENFRMSYFSGGPTGSVGPIGAEGLPGDDFTTYNDRLSPFVKQIYEMENNILAYYKVKQHGHTAYIKTCRRNHLQALWKYGSRKEPFWKHKHFKSFDEWASAQNKTVNIIDLRIWDESMIMSYHKYLKKKFWRVRGFSLTNELGIND